MTEPPSFVIRSNGDVRAGALIMLASIGMALLLARWWGGPVIVRALLGPPTLIALLAGLLMVLGVAEVEVDPKSALLTRRRGILPFVRRTRVAFSEVAKVERDLVRRRKGRANIESEYNILRLRFQDGTEWELFEEFHTRTRVRELADRLSGLTGAPMSFGRLGPSTCLPE